MDLERLFTAQKGALRSVLARMAPDSDVDDLLQETLIKASRALASYRGEASPETWLQQIARNTALDFLRSRRHRQSLRNETLELEADGEEKGGLVEPAVGTKRLEKHEMNGCIREYVERLAPAHREIIALKDLEGLSNPEIAARLGISLGSAKIRLHRAREALRESLARGCEFYQSDTGTLACDRRSEKTVSLSRRISSKEVRPVARARRAKVAGRNKTTKETEMNMPSSCGCAAPSPYNANACAAPQAGFSPIAAEYVAIGAAIGANCEPCLRYHVNEALKVGISHADIAKAVAMAARVKETPARNILKLAERLTNPGAPEQAGAPASCGCA